MKESRKDRARREDRARQELRKYGYLLFKEKDNRNPGYDYYIISPKECIQWGYDWRMSLEEVERFVAGK